MTAPGRPAGEAFDVVVLGAGPGGEDVTSDLLSAGLSVALVEPELIGGECFNWACVPSKAMLRPGHALRSARRVPGAREAVGDRYVDAASALAHRDDTVLHHDDATVLADFESAGAVFFRGRGQLAGPRSVVVETADGAISLRARHAVVLATGSAPVMPAIPGLAEAKPWTNREATSARRAPGRLVVIGSGASGLELAQAWQSLGSTVTVLSRREVLLPEHEPYVGELVLQGLRESGVDVRLGASATRVSRPRPGAAAELELDDGTRLEADEVLVATGKAPVSRRLGLGSVGIAEGGFLAADDSMAVGGTDWLYAIGDVNGRALVTHQASYHARVAAAAIAARSRGEQPTLLAEADAYAVPQVIFTDPEVAAVGLTRKTAGDRGLRARYVETDLGAVLGAGLHAQGYTGRASLLIDDDRDVLLGAAFVGQDVADLLHSATVAIVGRVPLRRLRHAVPSFPTISEVWLDLLRLAG